MTSFKIGNTYRKLDGKDAPKLQKGKPRVHEWQVYVDVVDGDLEAIETVDFFACYAGGITLHLSTCMEPVWISTDNDQRDPVRVARRFQTPLVNFSRKSIRCVKIHLYAAGYNHDPEHSMEISYPLCYKESLSLKLGCDVVDGYIQSHDEKALRYNYYYECPLFETKLQQKDRIKAEKKERQAERDKTRQYLVVHQQKLARQRKQDRELLKRIKEDATSRATAGTLT